MHLTLLLTADRVLTPDEALTPGWLRVSGDRIVDVGSGAPAEQAGLVDLGPVTLVPGFVDIHAHGGGGASFSAGADSAARVLAIHRAHGTTSMLASLVTDELDLLEHQIRDLAPLAESGEVLGIHLEGPWLSPSFCGAHDPALLRDPAVAEIDRLLDAGGGAVRMVTLAPERPGGIAAVTHLVRRGVLAAAGHSAATYAEASQAVDAGVTVATHLFNAARPFHHREPGPVVALLERDEVAVELIADGVHLHNAVLRQAASSKPGRFVLVSDAMAAAGSGDGDFLLGPRTVQVRDGVARLEDGGAIAGSTLTLDRAIRYAVTQASVDLGDAIRAVTRTPADLLGRPDLGRIAPGAQADLAALDDDLRVVAVLRRGAWQRPPPPALPA